MSVAKKNWAIRTVVVLIVGISFPYSVITEIHAGQQDSSRRNASQRDVNQVLVNGTSLKSSRRSSGSTLNSKKSTTSQNNPSSRRIIRLVSPAKTNSKQPDVSAKTEQAVIQQTRFQGDESDRRATRHSILNRPTHATSSRNNGAYSNGQAVWNQHEKQPAANDATLQDGSAPHDEPPQVTENKMKFRRVDEIIASPTGGEATMPAPAEKIVVPTGVADAQARLIELTPSHPSHKPVNVNFSSQVEPDPEFSIPNPSLNTDGFDTSNEANEARVSITELDLYSDQTMIAGDQDSPFRESQKPVIAGASKENVVVATNDVSDLINYRVAENVASVPTSNPEPSPQPVVQQQMLQQGSPLQTSTVILSDNSNPSKLTAGNVKSRNFVSPNQFLAAEFAQDSTQSNESDSSIDRQTEQNIPTVDNANDLTAEPSFVQRDDGFENFGDQDDSATDNSAADLAAYRSELRQPLSTLPVQDALSYTREDGTALEITNESPQPELYLVRFNQMGVPAPLYRSDAYGGSWYAKCTVWKSPNICYQPLYFEDPNLERFGGTRGLWQPAYSAAHFFASVVKFPYKLGQDPYCQCQYTAGFGRPGNQYCLQRERMVWNTRALTFQALFATGAAFALP